MPLTVWLAANTLYYPEGGGHLWVYLNWALGLRALGCRVIWQEEVDTQFSSVQLKGFVTALKDNLRPYGLADCVALASKSGEPLPGDLLEDCLDLEATAEADLLLNFRYSMSAEVIRRSRRSALVDIDPGLLQIWIAKGQLALAAHDTYFTTGETVGQPGTSIPATQESWLYTPPCVALSWWCPCAPATDGAFTTISHWHAEEWVESEAGQPYRNDKRTGFLPFLDLPRHTTQPLELALCLGINEDEERAHLRARGWRLRESAEVSSTPWDYQHYIQTSLGEFSCAKPSCVRLQNAWLSDRTLCYLASGKPAIVQHTGPSCFLPDTAGLFRFRDLHGAANCLETVWADYERHCRLARALAEEYFDARKVVARVLERALV